MEHVALQAANVLNSEQANRMSVFIIRAFVKLREIALTTEVPSRKFKVLEDRVTEHDTIPPPLNFVKLLLISEGG